MTSDSSPLQLQVSEPGLQRRIRCGSSETQPQREPRCTPFLAEEKNLYYTMRPRGLSRSCLRIDPATQRKGELLRTVHVPHIRRAKLYIDTLRVSRPGMGTTPALRSLECREAVQAVGWRYDDPTI